MLLVSNGLGRKERGSGLGLEEEELRLRKEGREHVQEERAKGGGGAQTGQ